MGKWVIPELIDEDMVLSLDSETILLLNNTLGDTPLSLLEEYVNDATSNQKIVKMFSNRVKLREKLNSAELDAKVRTIMSLTYDMIQVGTDYDYLREVRDAMDEIQKDEELVAYIPPVTASSVKEFKEHLKLRMKETKDVSPVTYSALKMLLDNITKLNRYGFIIDSHDYNKGTVVKQILRNKDEYDCKRRGLDFLIAREGQNPNKWRLV